MKITQKIANTSFTAIEMCLTIIVIIARTIFSIISPAPRYIDMCSENPRNKAKSPIWRTNIFGKVPGMGCNGWQQGYEDECDYTDF